MKLLKLLFVLVLFVGLSIAGYAYGTKDSVTFTVKSAVPCEGGTERNQHSYLIFTQEGEVLGNSDSLLHQKSDSSEIHSKLVPGKRYTASVYGFRFPLLCNFRNVLDLKEAQ